MKISLSLKGYKLPTKKTCGVQLDNEYLNFVLVLGNGHVSNGIRKALRIAYESTNPGKELSAPELPKPIPLRALLETALKKAGDRGLTGIELSKKLPGYYHSQETIQAEIDLMISTGGYETFVRGQPMEVRGDGRLHVGRFSRESLLPLFTLTVLE